jgi:nucleotide-binding universal stress UspA family protein
MTIVVGYAPDARGTAALHFAATLARSSDDSLLVCAVVPRAWYPSMAKIDAEYQAALDDQADEALAEAKRQVPADITAIYVRRPARSAPAGLLEVAEETNTPLVVVGSATAGAFGHVSLGSVTDRLLHSAHVPVAIAPRGFRAKPGAIVRRVTAAFGGTEESTALAVAAAEVAAEMGATLRLATFAVWSRPAYTMRLGADGEDSVLQTWLEESRQAMSETLDRVKAQPQVPDELETAVGIGESWPDALDDVEWADGDVLVVGSSVMGPVARVFLGSRGSKIVRNSPVPVIVVPRDAGTPSLRDRDVLSGL